jgi:hypothetical protein
MAAISRPPPLPLHLCNSTGLVWTRFQDSADPESSIFDRFRALNGLPPPRRPSPYGGCKPDIHNRRSVFSPRSCARSSASQGGGQFLLAPRAQFPGALHAWRSLAAAFALFHCASANGLSREQSPIGVGSGHAQLTFPSHCLDWQQCGPICVSPSVAERGSGFGFLADRGRSASC